MLVCRASTSARALSSGRSRMPSCGSPPVQRRGSAPLRAGRLAAAGEPVPLGLGAQHGPALLGDGGPPHGVAVSVVRGVQDPGVRLEPAGTRKPTAAAVPAPRRCPTSRPRPDRRRGGSSPGGRATGRGSAARGATPAGARQPRRTRSATWAAASPTATSSRSPDARSLDLDHAVGEAAADGHDGRARRSARRP